MVRLQSRVVMFQQSLKALLLVLLIQRSTASSVPRRKIGFAYKVPYLIVISQERTADNIKLFIQLFGDEGKSGMFLLDSDINVDLETSNTFNRKTLNFFQKKLTFLGKIEKVAFKMKGDGSLLICRVKVMDGKGYQHSIYKGEDTDWISSNKTIELFFQKEMMNSAKADVYFSITEKLKRKATYFDIINFRKELLESLKGSSWTSASINEGRVINRNGSLFYQFGSRYKTTLPVLYISDYNPCITKHNFGCKQLCSHEVGYNATCKCFEGYELEKSDNKTCIDLTRYTSSSPPPPPTTNAITTPATKLPPKLECTFIAGVIPGQNLVINGPISGYKCANECMYRRRNDSSIIGASFNDKEMLCLCHKEIRDLKLVKYHRSCIFEEHPPKLSCTFTDGNIYGKRFNIESLISEAACASLCINEKKKEPAIIGASVFLSIGSCYCHTLYLRKTDDRTYRSCLFEVSKEITASSVISSSHVEKPTPSSVSKEITASSVISSSHVEKPTPSSVIPLSTYIPFVTTPLMSISETVIPLSTDIPSVTTPLMSISETVIPLSTYIPSVTTLLMSISETVIPLSTDIPSVTTPLMSISETDFSTSSQMSVEVTGVYRSASISSQYSSFPLNSSRPGVSGPGLPPPCIFRNGSIMGKRIFLGANLTAAQCATKCITEMGEKSDVVGASFNNGEAKCFCNTELVGWNRDPQYTSCVLPQIHLEPPYMINASDCFEKCGSRAGNCPSYCGIQGYCCKKDGAGCNKTLQRVVTSGHYSCVLAPDNDYTNWLPWSQCSKSCGFGTTVRYRYCKHKNDKKALCHFLTDTKDEKLCNEFMCPVDGTWSEWSQWTECSTSCGTGIVKRSRHCHPPLYGGNDCKRSSSENHDVQEQTCNGILSSCPGIYTSNQSCSKVCREKDLSCKKNMIEFFNSETMYVMSNLTCSKNISDARKIYHNLFDPSYNYSSKQCQGYIGSGLILCDAVPMNESIRICQCIPEDELFFGAWSQWGDCSVSCGSGQQIRRRERDQILGAMNNNPSAIDARSCTIDCPESGQWGDWTPFSKCSVTCGLGLKYRYRFCDSPQPLHGGPFCRGDANDAEVCGEMLICPQNGGWSPWSEFSKCDKPCNGGYKERYRTCDQPIPQFNGLPCEGESVERKECNKDKACISVALNVQLVFEDEKYNSSLRDLNSSYAAAFKKKINAQIKQLYTNHLVSEEYVNRINVTIISLEDADTMSHHLRTFKGDP